MSVEKRSVYFSLSKIAVIVGNDNRWEPNLSAPPPFKYRVVSRIPNPNAKAADGLPLGLSTALVPGLGIRAPNLRFFGLG